MSKGLVVAAVMLIGVGSCGGEAEERQAAAAQAPARPVPPPPQSSAPKASATAMLPPGAVIGSDSPGGEAASIVFDSREPPGRLLAWYRSPGRRADFRLESELQEGAEQVLSGTSCNGAFTVRLAPGGNGGTAGTLLFDGP